MVLRWIVCFFLATTNFCPVVANEIDNRPIVVFRIDDCQTSWRTPYQGLDNKSGLEYGKIKKIPITWAIIAGRAHDPARSLTWSELQDYLSVAGGEAASHSVSHCAMPTTQDYINELTESKAIIEANLPGYKCTTFIQPGPWAGDADLYYFTQLDNPIGLAIQSNFDQSMAYLGDGFPRGANWRITDVYYRYGMNISCAGLAAEGGWTPELVSASLDVVAETPGLIWIVFTHGVQETGGTAGGCVTADLLASFMDKLAELRDQGKIRLMGLHDAFATTFATNLNRVPDPGFEHTNIPASLIAGPWNISAGSVIRPSGGIDNSRYAFMPAYGTSVKTSSMVLAPGKYELNWYQKREAGIAEKKQLWVTATNSDGRGATINVIDWFSNYNAASEIWEQKKAYFVTKDRMPSTYITFSVAPDAAYGVDNVSVLPHTLNPNVSPTNSKAFPGANQCKITWDTPSDESVKSIVIRCDTCTHPTSTTKGSSFATVPAVPGTRQEVTAAIDWSKQRNCVFFSVFAVKDDGEYSPPDLVYVAIDKTHPADPVVNICLRRPSKLTADWTSSDPQSGIYEYQYSIGYSPGASDYIDWTSTQQNEVSLSNLPIEQWLYFNLKSRNSFGFCSDIVSHSFIFRHAISDGLNEEDGSDITVSGIVIGIFNGFYYIEQEDKSRGLRIIGDCQRQIGSAVSLTGVLTTVNGERALIPD